MRSFLLFAALAITSVTGNVAKRQEEGGSPETSTTIVDSSPGGTPSTSATTPSGSANPCAQTCDAATVIYSSCHNDANSLACFCQSRSINTLAACASCRRSNGLNDEAEALEEQIGGIIQACNSQSSTVAPPSGITITKTASVNPSQITAPAGAKLTGSGSKAASATKSGASSSPSAAGSPNGASPAHGVAGTIAGLVGVGAVALFL
ncbi:hypothetical protein AAF712_014627 [Marasmius tenuissimus]|uniref:Extracellular membrane protein CFEM domain-containing protein n=1 Tax=Marasmius tenuissimus TaxID=585030 RepID=A0ABR2ZD43_9AGAR